MHRTEVDWDEDCQRYWGRKLTGKRRHWCPDWDFLPIDETTRAEIDGCTCDLSGITDQKTGDALVHTLVHCNNS